MSYLEEIKDYVEGFYDGPHATPKESDHGPIFLGIKNVTPDGRLDFTEIRHVSPEEFPRWTKRVVPQKDDIVFSYEATLHRYALIPEGFEGCLGRRMALIRPNKNRIDPRFLHYYMLSSAWRKEAEASVISGATVDRIPLTKVPNFKVSFPSLNKQKKISNILGSYDDLIENNKRRIVLLEESARQLYKEWFVRFRFPGHEHVKIIDGVPEGWTPCYVGDLFTLQRGFDLPVRDRIDGNIPVYASTGINGYHNEHKVKGPGLVTGRSGSLGKVIYISKDFWPLNTALWIKEFKQVDVCFALYLLRNLKLENYNGGAAVPTLNRNDVHSIETFLPPQNMLESFSENIKPVFAQIDLLDEQNIKLTKARDLLLPKLMSGAINV